MPIVLLASKHDLDPKLLIDAFFEALENGISRCGSLKISCRGVNKEYATFLIIKDEKVVWQFPINQESIRNPDTRKFIQTIPMPDRVKKDIYETNQKIGDLRYGMKGITIKAKMVEIPPAKLVITRWGSSACVSNVTIADDTGKIQLGLWNDQIEMVNIGDDVEVNNSSVSRFKGELHLRLGRKSTISVIN